MINSESFYNKLAESGFDFFTGVPDSTFKEFIKFINFKAGDAHIVAASEGEAMGIALESTSGAASIKVMIHGIATAKVYPDGNNLTVNTKLSPYTTNAGEVTQALAPNVGEVIGWLLEAADGSVTVERKIWVQPC